MTRLASGPRHSVEALSFLPDRSPLPAANKRDPPRLIAEQLGR
jgi:hypothetical protein